MPLWRHPMETFFALLALWEGNPPITSEFPSQWPVTQCFDIFFYLLLNKRLSKQSRQRWFEAPLSSLWCYCNDIFVLWFGFGPFIDVLHNCFTRTGVFMILSRGPLLILRIKSIQAWISNHIHYKLWYAIIHPCLNFNGATTEIWEWISNFFPHFAGMASYNWLFCNTIATNAWGKRYSFCPSHNANHMQVQQRCRNKMSSV